MSGWRDSRDKRERRELREWLGMRDKSEKLRQLGLGFESCESSFFASRVSRARGLYL